MNNNVHVNVPLIKQLRRALGYSQSDMAVACQKKRLNIALSTIKRMECGKPVSLRTLRNIALFHQCSIKELVIPDARNVTSDVHSVTQCSAIKSNESIQKTLDICGYDYELEQFEGVMMRSLKVCTPHLICLKSDEISKAELLSSLLLKLSNHKRIITHQLSIHQGCQLWYTPLQELLKTFNHRNDHDGLATFGQLCFESQIPQCIEQLVAITQKQKAPRVIFINQIDNAHPIFIEFLAQLMCAIRQCSLIFIITAKLLSDNLTLLQHKTTFKVPKLTIELPANAVESSNTVLI